MKVIQIFGRDIFAWGSKETLAPKKLPEKYDVKTLPAGRQSVPSHNDDSILSNFGGLNVIQPASYNDLIPLIRSLAYSNHDVSQALNNIIELGNTGHIIKFDASVSAEQQNLMKAHLDAKKEMWGDATAGMDGLVNKMMAQVMISGALSSEWLAQFDLKGLKGCALVLPESIRFIYNNRLEIYEPYQYVNGYIIKNKSNEQNLKKLNPHTFKYYALNGDTDIPYGIPPYLSVLEPLSNQKYMLENIRFIIQQIGIMGFMNVLLEKPDQKDDENIEDYKVRLEQFLEDAKTKVQEGFRDGITVGYKEDTEFDFKPTGRNFEGVDKMYELNNQNVSSGFADSV